MKTKTQTRQTTTVAARVHGEDIQQADFVAVLNEIVEYASCCWNYSELTLPADQPVRIRYMPHDAGEPYKVIAICLPFVYAKRPKGGVETFDIRKRQLVRLNGETARAVWKRLKKFKKKKN